MKVKNFSIKAAIVFSFHSMLEHWRLYIALSFAGVALLATMIGITFLFDQNSIQLIDGSFVANITTFNMAYIFSILPILLLYIIFYLSFSAGNKKIALNLYDTNTSSVKVLFSSFRFLLKILISGILYNILVFLGTMCFIIPGIIAALRFIFFPYFIVDQHCGPVEALTSSYNATKGHVWYMLKLVLIVSLIAAIGNVFIWPFSMLAYAFAYRQLVTAQQNA